MRTLSRLIWLSTLAITGPTFADGNSEWKPSELYVRAAVDIDAQGKIVHLNLLRAQHEEPELPAQMLSLARSTIANWEFTPATVNGKPAPAHTFVDGTFEFKEQGRNYQARVRYVSHGPRLDRIVAPRYPKEMIEAHSQADLMMLVLVHPDGSLSDIHLEWATSTQKRPVIAFTQSATLAISQWRAQPESVDGHAVSSWVRIPINYYLDSVVRGQRDDPHLERAVDSPADPQPSVSGGESMALDSPVALRNASS